MPTSQGHQSSPSDQGDEDWEHVLHQLQVRFSDMSPKKVADALKSCNGHAGRAAATLRALKNGGESAGSLLGSTGLRTMRLGTTDSRDTGPTDKAETSFRYGLEVVKVPKEQPEAYGKTRAFSKTEYKSIFSDDILQKSLPTSPASSATDHLTSLLSGAMASWPSRPAQRSLLPAQIWVARYQPPPINVVRLSYPNNVQVDLPKIAQTMVSAAVANKSRMSYMCEVLESGGHLHSALRLFRQHDEEGNGYLVWDGGKMRDLIHAVFEHYGLVPPSSDQMRHVCQIFGELDNKDAAILGARECICVIDVIFVSIRAAASLMVEQKDASLHSSPAEPTPRSLAGYSCSDSLDVRGLVEVRLKSASKLKNTGVGLFSRVSDPFAVARVGLEEHTTETVYNTLSPVWKAPAFTFTVDLAKPAQRVLHLEVLDHSSIHRNKTFGKAEVSLVGLTPDQTMLLRESLHGGSGGEVEFELKFVGSTYADGISANGSTKPIASNSVATSAGSGTRHFNSGQTHLPFRHDTRSTTSPESISRYTASPESIVRRLDESLGAAPDPQADLGSAALHVESPLIKEAGGAEGFPSHICPDQVLSNRVCSDMLAKSLGSPADIQSTCVTEEFQSDSLQDTRTSLSTAAANTATWFAQPLSLNSPTTCSPSKSGSSPVSPGMFGSQHSSSATNDRLSPQAQAITKDLTGSVQAVVQAMNDVDCPPAATGWNAADESLKSLISRIELGLEAGAKILKTTTKEQQEVASSRTFSSLTIDQRPPDSALSPDAVNMSSEMALEISKEVPKALEMAGFLATADAFTTLAEKECKALTIQPSEIGVTGDVLKPDEMAAFVAKADHEAKLFAEKELKDFLADRGDTTPKDDAPAHREILAWQQFCAIFEGLRVSQGSPSASNPLRSKTTNAVFFVTESMDYEQSHSSGDPAYAVGDEFLMCLEEADVEIQLRVRGLKAGTTVQIMYEHSSVSRGSQQRSERLVTELRTGKPKASPNVTLGLDTYQVIKELSVAYDVNDQQHEASADVSKEVLPVEGVTHQTLLNDAGRDTTAVSIFEANEARDHETPPELAAEVQVLVGARNSDITEADSYGVAKYKLESNSEGIPVEALTGTEAFVSYCMDEFHSKLEADGHSHRESTVLNEVEDRSESVAAADILEPLGAEVLTMHDQSIERIKPWEPPVMESPSFEDKFTLGVTWPAWTGRDPMSPAGKLQMEDLLEKVDAEEVSGRLSATESGKPFLQDAGDPPIYQMGKVELVDALATESDFPRCALETSSVVRLRLLLRSVRGEQLRKAPLPRGVDLVAERSIAIAPVAREENAIAQQDLECFGLQVRSTLPVQALQDMQLTSVRLDEAEAKYADISRQVESLKAYNSLQVSDTQAATLSANNADKCQKLEEYTKTLEERLLVLEKEGTQGSSETSDTVARRENALAAKVRAAESLAKFEASRRRALEEEISSLKEQVSELEQFRANQSRMDASCEWLQGRISILEHTNMEGNAAVHRPDVIEFNGGQLHIFSEDQLQDMHPSHLVDYAQHLHQAVGPATVRSAPPDNQADRDGIVRWIRRLYWNHVAPQLEKHDKVAQHFSKDSLSIRVQSAKMQLCDYVIDSGIYCTVLIPGQMKSMCKTSSTRLDNPVWNQELSICDYITGQPLEFVIMQEAEAGSKDVCLGRAQLPGIEFYPDGFEGELSIDNPRACFSCSLKVVVKVHNAKHFSQALVPRESGLRQQLEQYQDQVSHLERTLADNDAKHEQALFEMGRKLSNEEAQTEVHKMQAQELTCEKMALAEQLEQSHKQIVEEREQTQKAVCEVRRLVQVLGCNGIKLDSRYAA